MRLKFEGVPVLETERLIMRGYEEQYFDGFAEMEADPEVMKHITGKASTREESWRKFLSATGAWSLLGFGYWMVFEKSSGRYIGDVGFSDMQRGIEPSAKGQPEIGWVLATWAHGKGYATEAAKAAMTWGLPQFGDVKPFCIMDPDYPPTIRVAEKCGFEKVEVTTYREEPCLVMEFRKPEMLD